jgi:transposase
MATAAARNEDKTSVDSVQLRDVLESLAKKQDRSALLDVVFGVLSKAETIIQEQSLEIEQLRKQLFGRRSEKIDPAQLSLFAQVLETIVAKDEQKKEDNDQQDTQSPKKRKRKKRRRPLEPTQRHKITVAEADRACPVCGELRCTIGHVRCLVIEYTPPKLEVIEYLREKVACRPCEGEVTIAPPPKERVIDGALPGPQMLAALTINKTVDGLPLNRTQKIFRRAGLDLPIQTLNRWEGFSHQLLEPIAARIKKTVLEADTINLDDTGLRVLDPTIKRETRRGHIWVFVGRKYDPGGDLTKTQEFVFYLYAPTWEAKYPETFLDGCNAVLQGDAYRGYERIASANRGDAVQKLLAGCCMHARRPFMQALDAKDPAAIFFVERFAALYRIEKRAKTDGLLASQRLELRQEKSLPILAEIKTRAEELSCLPLCKPIKTGVTYLLNQWDKLLVPFTTDGRLEIDNGSAERWLRGVASGRKAWLFAGSQGVATSPTFSRRLAPGPISGSTTCSPTAGERWPSRQPSKLLKSTHPFACPLRSCIYHQQYTVVS